MKEKEDKIKQLEKKIEEMDKEKRDLIAKVERITQMSSQQQAVALRDLKEDMDKQHQLDLAKKKDQLEEEFARQIKEAEEREKKA